MVCKVHGCRYADSHNSASHLCGKCKKNGHGQYECSKPTEIIQLQLDPDYSKEMDPVDYCQHLKCRYNKSHKSIAHTCSICKDNHSSLLCPTAKPVPVNTNVVIKTICCPICRASNNIMTNSNLVVFGTSSKCCICQEDESNIIFPDCRHACTCTTCFNKL